MAIGVLAIGFGKPLMPSGIWDSLHRLGLDKAGWQRIEQN
jgi:hypothetical protein